MSNKPTLQDIEAAVDKLGHDAGEGKNAQVRFMLQMIEGGYHNALDLNKNKHGADRDDATILTERYVKKQTGAAVFDAKAPNQRKAISWARTGIKLGGWPKGGNGEPIATCNQFVSEWVKLRKTVGAGKLVDCNNALLAFARTQLKRDTLIAASEFDSFYYKPQADDATAEEIIASAVKKLDGLIAGTAAHGTAQCNTPHIINARNNLRQELAAIAKAKAPAPGQPATV